MDDLFITENIIIPESELEITAARAGGPGGQHVNKTNTRIIIRWNVKNTNVLNEEQKLRILKNLESKLTTEGDLIVSNNETRSQIQNRKNALFQLAEIINKSLRVPKKRKPTKIPKKIKETILQRKKQRSQIKKLRSKKNYE